MAFGDLVQGPREAKNISTSIAPSWSTVPIANNVLWALAMHAGGAAIPSTPAGWTLVESAVGASFSAALWLKLAAGSDAVPTVTWGSSDEIYLGIGELEWGLGTLVIASNKDETNINTNVSSQSSGAVTADDETTNVFFGVVGIERGANYDPGESITAGGFTQIGSATANNRPGAVYGSLVNASGSNSFTVTSGDGSDFVVGFITALSETAGTSVTAGILTKGLTGSPLINSGLVR